jgi:alpha-D-ribose 1-methylphosphonate 5-phosphate C-P lyase
MQVFEVERPSPNTIDIPPTLTKTNCFHKLQEKGLMKIKYMYMLRGIDYARRFMKSLI